MADGAISGFLQAFTAVSQQRFENQLALRRQQQEETQFQRQMQLAQMKLDYEKQLNEQQMARQEKMDQLAIEERKYEAKQKGGQQRFENQLAIKGLQIREQGQMQERAGQVARDQQVEERNRLQMQIKGMEAYGKLRGAYDKKVAEAMDLERKRGIAAGLGEPVPELDFQYQKSIQDLLGMRSDMSRLEQGFQTAAEQPTEEMPVTEQGTPEPGEAEPAEIPGGGEAPAETAEQPAPATEGVSTTQQAPEAYPGARFMGGRPQPATKAEADEIEADRNAKLKAINRPGNTQIQSVPEKLEGAENEVKDLANSASTVNRFFRMGANTRDMSLAPTTEKGDAVGIYKGRSPTDPESGRYVDPHDPELDKDGAKKRYGIADVIETYTETAPTVQPALGRVYQEYVVGPLVEQARAVSAPKEGIDVIEANPFDVLKAGKEGQNAVLGKQAIAKAIYLQQKFGITVQPLPPAVIETPMNAGEILDRVNDEIFEGGGAPPSATLSIMDRLLQPDQPDATYSPAAMQKIDDLVNNAQKAVDDARLVEDQAAMTSGYQGAVQQRGNIRTAENVLRALQNTQTKMRNAVPMGPRVPPSFGADGLRTPELRQFGGLLQQGMGIQEAKKRAAESKPVGQGGGGPLGMRGALTMAAMVGLQGQAPAQKPEQKQAPAPEASLFNKTLGSIGANTKDKNVVAQAAIGAAKDEYGKMDKAEKATAQKSWQGTRVIWQNFGVKPSILRDMNVAVGLPADDGLKEEKPKKKEEPTAKDKAKGMTPLTPQQKAEKERKEAAEKRRKEVLEKQKKKAG